MLVLKFALTIMLVVKANFQNNKWRPNLNIKVNSLRLIQSDLGTLFAGYTSNLNKRKDKTEAIGRNWRWKYIGVERA